MNRRNLLSVAAASVMLSAAVRSKGITVTVTPSSHPDAELIAACVEYLRIQRALSAYCANAGEKDIEPDDPGLAMWKPIPALIEQIVAFRATTAEGHLARARCMAFPYLPGHPACHDDPEAAPEDRFEAAQLRDLVAMERGTETPSAIPPVAADELSRATHPDADLLKACTAFDVLERAYIAAGGDYASGSLEQDMADAERARLSDAQDPLVERMCELHAVTREGQAARARSLALWDAELMKPGPGDTGTWLTAAIVRDLIGEGAA